MNERILTLHPEGKQGVNIAQSKYEIIRTAILKSLAEYGKLTFSELMRVVDERLTGRFEGSISWYVTTVKLDLEARQEIERVPGKRPQQLRLVE